MWKCYKPWTIGRILYWSDRQRKRRQETGKSEKFMETPKYQISNPWGRQHGFLSALRKRGVDTIVWPRLQKARKLIDINSNYKLYIYNIHKEFIPNDMREAWYRIISPDRWHSGSLPGLSNCTAQFRGVCLPGDPHDLSHWSLSIGIICWIYKDIKDIWRHSRWLSKIWILVQILSSLHSLTLPSEFFRLAIKRLILSSRVCKTGRIQSLCIWIWRRLKMLEHTHPARWQCEARDGHKLQVQCRVSSIHKTWLSISFQSPWPQETSYYLKWFLDTNSRYFSKNGLQFRLAPWMQNLPAVGGRIKSHILL